MFKRLCPPDQNRCLYSVYFQDDRLWLQYGGNWGAAGNADLCPEDYNGKAYVSEQEWDISGLQACTPGSTCPVSKTFTDTRFMVPQGCSAIRKIVILSRFVALSVSLIQKVSLFQTTGARLLPVCSTVGAATVGLGRDCCRL